jgi:gamma-glutamyltranspeptidase/glutathione hydrolase
MTDAATRSRIAAGLFLFAGGVLFVPLRPAAAEKPAAPSADAPALTAEGRQGMVVSVSGIASAVGRDVLRAGGNAVDAAVATSFALAVTWPEAGNLGGGGFMLVYPPGGREPAVVDYRETAPAAATRDMFAGPKPASSYLMVGTPGTVRGLYLAHQRYGKRPWKSLVEPAVRLADEGFAVNVELARSLNGVLKKYGTEFPELRRVYGKGDGAPWREGDRLVQKDLAGTLRRIADGGADGFYKGPTAERIAAEMKSGGGLITAADLAAYEAKVRAPVHTTYRGYDVYGPPPPSSGGTALVEMLNVLEPFELRNHGRWSLQTLHLMAEAMRRAYCDRARYLGDPAFVKVPAFLTTRAHAARLAKGIDPARATLSAELAGDIPLSGEGSETTHFSVVDKDGMAVSTTTTLEDGFGGRIVVRGAGFLLNNEMGDFNPRPGVTTRGGLIGTPANQVAPGKRMLSSMTPVVVARDGKAVLVTGSPGGRTIMNTVLCVVLNVLEFDMPVREAVDAPRVHHQWLPDVLHAEPALHKDHADALAALRKMGHHVAAKPVQQGDAHTIQVDPRTGVRTGAADPRRGGRAVGY